jgi:hypothetical protein
MRDPVLFSVLLKYFDTDNHGFIICRDQTPNIRTPDIKHLNHILVNAKESSIEFVKCTDFYKGEYNHTVVRYTERDNELYDFFHAIVARMPRNPTHYYCLKDSKELHIAKCKFESIDSITKFVKDSILARYAPDAPEVI